MNPGKLRHKIDFLKPPSEKDSYGEQVKDWPTYKTGIRASKNPLLGNEFYTALTTGSKVEVKFNCRYIPGVTNEMRIRHGSEIYEILSAIDVKTEHKELVCYCRLVR